MNRFVQSLVLFTVLFVTGAAHADLAFPKDAAYSADTFSETSAFNQDFDKIFKSSGYAKLEPEGHASLSQPLLWLNRIYSRKGGSRVYAKGGLHLTGGIAYGKVYGAGQPGKFIGHVADLTNGDHVFFFDGMSESAAQELLTRIGQTVDSASRTAARRGAFASLLVREARAEEPPVPNTFCATEPAKTAAKDEGQTLLNNVVTRCGWGAVKGAWNSTGGLVTGAISAVGSGIYYSVHPIEAAQKVYGAAQSATNFVQNFDAYMGKIVEGAANLPINDKADILCELTSTIGTGAVVTALTTGAGSTALAVNIAKVTAKLADAGKLKGIKSVQALKEGTAAKAEASVAYDIANGAKNTRVADALKEAQNANLALRAAEEKAAAAKTALETYQLGDKSKKLAEMNQRIKNASLMMSYNEMVPQATASLASVQKAFALDKNLDSFISKLTKDLKGLEKQIEKAGTDQQKLAKVSAERARLSGEVSRAVALIEKSPHEMIPPTKKGWPTYEVARENELRKATLEAGAAEAKASEARVAASKKYDSVLKVENPELAKEARLAKQQRTLFPALAACNAMSNISGAAAPAAAPATNTQGTKATQ